MNLILNRKNHESYGIFGELTYENGSFFCMTLEHSYLVDGAYLPKVPKGVYTCVRGPHQLASMDKPFETFEITGVEGHANILFHVGNYNQDSSGCVLLGQFIGAMLNGNKMITNSKVTFDKFMLLQSGVDSFTLTVT